MRQVKKKKNNQWKKKVLGFLGVVLCIVSGALMVWQSPYCQAVVQNIRNGWAVVSDKAPLLMNQAVIEGRYYTSEKEILQAVGLQQGMSLYDIDLEQVHQNLESLPWVDKAVVKRFMRATNDEKAGLIIKIQEKMPIALWQYQKKYKPLDKRGKPIQDTTAKLDDDILLVVGEDAPKHTPALIMALEKYPALNVRVRSAVRVGGRRWNLILNDAETGMEILLPETDIETALKRVVEQDEKEGLLKKNLKIIDVRYDDRVVVRMTKGG